jgi:hypothetical protein
MGTEQIADLTSHHRPGIGPGTGLPKENVMSIRHSIRTARASALALASASLLAGGVALAGSASAAATTVPLAPGQSTCIQQYAGYQVRANGSATADGARFKLLKDGAVIDATPGRVSNWSV